MYSLVQRLSLGLIFNKKKNRQGTPLDDAVFRAALGYAGPALQTQLNRVPKFAKSPAIKKFMGVVVIIEVHDALRKFWIF